MSFCCCFWNWNNQGELCILVFLELRIKVNFHGSVYGTPVYTPLRCTSSLLGVFLFREKISLLNGSISSPSPCLYSQSGLGGRLCLQFYYLVIFPYQFLGVFFLGGGRGWQYCLCPLGRFRDSIKTSLRGFVPLTTQCYEATINWSLTSWLLIAVSVKIWKALVFICVFRDI